MSMPENTDNIRYHPIKMRLTSKQGETLFEDDSLMEYSLGRNDAHQIHSRWKLLKVEGVLRVVDFGQFQNFLATDI